MIEFHQKYAPTALFDEAVVNRQATSEDAGIFSKSNVPRTLVLNVFRGWDGDLCSAAEAFRNVPVKSLQVFLHPGTDVEPIHNFHQVEHLSVVGLGKGTLYLDAFENLRSYGPGTESKGKYIVKIEWGKCRNLKRTGGLGSSLPTIEQLVTFPKLTSLDEIEFSYWNKLSSLSELEKPERYKKIHLHTSKLLQDYSALIQMKNLRSVSFENCPEFPSVHLIDDLEQLEELFLVGVKIRDPDTSSLLTHPSLKRIALKQQKHLKPSRDELEAHFLKKYGR
jgi:hypothetical protein